MVPVDVEPSWYTNQDTVIPGCTDTQSTARAIMALRSAIASILIDTARSPIAYQHGANEPRQPVREGQAHAYAYDQKRGYSCAKQHQGTIKVFHTNP